jgi:hypothetical protein
MYERKDHKVKMSGIGPPNLSKKKKNLSGLSRGVGCGVSISTLKCPRGVHFVGSYVLGA